MNMSMNLSTMLYQTMNCKECGQPLSTPTDAAGDREIDSNIAMTHDPATVAEIVKGDNAVCGKCGRPYRKTVKVWLVKYQCAYDRVARMPCWKRTAHVQADSRKEAIAKVKACFGPPRYDKFSASPLPEGTKPDCFFN